MAHTSVSETLWALKTTDLSGAFSSAVTALNAQPKFRATAKAATQCLNASYDAFADDLTVSFGLKDIVVDGDGTVSWKVAGSKTIMIASSPNGNIEFTIMAVCPTKFKSSPPSSNNGFDLVPLEFNCYLVEITCSFYSTTDAFVLEGILDLGLGNCTPLVKLVECEHATSGDNDAEKAFILSAFEKTFGAFKQV